MKEKYFEIHKKVNICQKCERFDMTKVDEFDTFFEAMRYIKGYYPKKLLSIICYKQYLNELNVPCYRKSWSAQVKTIERLIKEGNFAYDEDIRG